MCHVQWPFQQSWYKDPPTFRFGQAPSAVWSEVYKALQDHQIVHGAWNGAGLIVRENDIAAFVAIVSAECPWWDITEARLMDAESKARRELERDEYSERLEFPPRSSSDRRTSRRRIMRHR